MVVGVGVAGGVGVAVGVDVGPRICPGPQLAMSRLIAHKKITTFNFLVLILISFAVTAYRAITQTVAKLDANPAVQRKS